jgi:hypothetical protein
MDLVRKGEKFQDQIISPSSPDVAAMPAIHSIFLLLKSQSIIIILLF